MTDFILGDCKIMADGDFSHEDAYSLVEKFWPTYASY